MCPLESSNNESIQVLPVSIADQYQDAAYSDFVEANPGFYHHYLHHCFFEHVRGEPQPPKRVLDLGCGNGVLSRKIWQPGTSIYATDLMDSMLDRARGLCRKQEIPLWTEYPSSPDGGVFFRQGNLLSVGTKDAVPQSHFDLAMSGFVLAHMTTTAEVQTVLELAHGSLRPGGLSLHLVPETPPTARAQEGQAFRVELPNEDKPIVLFDVHWDESTYVEAMKRAGFVDVSIQELEFRPGTTEEWKESNGHPKGYKLLKGRKAE